MKQIPRKTWDNYINKLSRIDKTAGKKVQAFINKNGIPATAAETSKLIDYSYGLVQTYGSASAALACEMYDSLSRLEGAKVPPAEPAELATYGETAKAINGTLKNSVEAALVPGAVERLTKMAGADTMIKNAIRDGAEWAWVPNGDTCVFCLTLASRGWQPASKAVLSGGHAEHIHAHCDCTFAIRHDSSTNVGEYDPDKYRKMYDDAEGESSKDKINAIRRANYQKNKDEINAQKRAAYAENISLQKVRDNDKIKAEMKNVNTNGHRNETELTSAQIKEAEQAARKQGYKGTIAYSSYVETSIANYPSVDGSHKDTDSLLIIGTDAFPAPGAETANERLTVDCCMAHEVIGHQGAWLRYTTQAESYLEEAQASLRASKFGIGLSEEERVLLEQDAMDRLRNAGVDYNSVKDVLDIKEP